MSTKLQSYKHVLIKVKTIQYSVKYEHNTAFDWTSANLLVSIVLF
jgi:hypothetical protein